MKTQKRTLKTTGSFFNWMMGNNNSMPIVGKGATVLCWTDRHAYEVLEVSEDQTECKIQKYAPKRLDKSGMSECQDYEYKELIGNIKNLVWKDSKGGGWFSKYEVIEFIPKFVKNCGETFVVNSLTKEQRKEIYQGECYPQKVVEGITKSYTRYSKINILFGVKEEYYDFSF